MTMTLDISFWQEFTQLIEDNAIVIDRPKGKPHPRYPDMIYPLDYGYLDNTSAGDGDGIDVWIGTLKRKTLTGILCTFDTFKRDAEIKLMIGCTQQNIHTIRTFNKMMHTLYIPNPTAAK